MWAGTRRLLLLSAPSPVSKYVHDRLSNADRLALSAAPHGSLAAVLDDAVVAAADALIAGGGRPGVGRGGLRAAARPRRRRARPSDRARSSTQVVAGARRRPRGRAPARAADRGAAPARARRRRASSSPGSSTPASSTATGVDRLADVERYLRAAARRLERLPDAVAVDRDRMNAVHELERAYRERLAAARAPRRCARSRGCSRSSASATSRSRSARAARSRPSGSGACWPRRELGRRSDRPNVEHGQHDLLAAAGRSCRSGRGRTGSRRQPARGSENTHSTKAPVARRSSTSMHCRMVDRSTTPGDSGQPYRTGGRSPPSLFRRAAPPRLDPVRPQRADLVVDLGRDQDRARGRAAAAERRRAVRDRRRRAAASSRGRSGDR